MPLDRTWYNTLVDDSGGGTNGTVWDKAAVDALMDDIDTALAAISATNTFADDLIFSANKLVRRNTSDGSDNGDVELQGGGGTGNTRGGSIRVYGNEHSTKPGHIDVIIGNIANALARVLRSDGNVALSVDGATGLLTLPYGQISFPASQNASATANVLDDYEEGVWTPVIGGSTSETGQAYTTQTATYTKTGRNVAVTAIVELSTEGTITGNLQIEGLPFAVSGNGSVPVLFGSLATNWVNVTGELSGSVINMYGCTAAAATNATHLTATDVNDTTWFEVSVSYNAA